MKVSIITASYNRAEMIKDMFESLRQQTHAKIEHIIVDGASTDNSIEVIKALKIPNTKFISEPDKGIYDAWNKGLEMATGDIVGFLNSDDFYPHNDIIAALVKTFEETGKDSVFGDVDYVKPYQLNKPVRHYSSKKFNPDRFAYGYMPAHPSFFVKREFYQRYGGFRLDYKIAADFEMMVRLLHTKSISYHYINKVCVHMRTGGISNSSLRNRLLLNQEIVRACHDSGIRTSLPKVLRKTFSKLLEHRF